ncbi:hypothetical protein, conserved [Eimeria brunetti]|uniref:Uncharacterized protein n=1 Tax=Eimeria brunetti TaxID=51314 RepID=U6LHZ8_9EIME|nr:hypothetical protein, conserved [Eimeria brunetti]
MAYYGQEERAPGCCLFDVPLIAAGAISDAVCCQGPKRDFQTEVEFRLANAAKMYPAGYTDVTPRYAYGHQYQYGITPPTYYYYKPPTTVNYAPEKVSTSPVGYFPYSVQPSPAPQRLAYHYEPENYFRSRPLAPQVEAAFPEPIGHSWAAPLGGAPLSPVRSSGVAAQVGIPIEVSQPTVLPSNEASAPNVWRTVEVVEVVSLVEQENDTEPNQEKNEEPVHEGQQLESKASQTEPKNEASKAGKEGKAAQRAPAAKRKAAAARKGARGQAQLEQPEGDEAVRDDTHSESPKGGTSANTAAPPVASVEREQVLGKAELKGQAKGTGEPPEQAQEGGHGAADEKVATDRQQSPVAANQQQPTTETPSKSEQTDVKEEGTTADEPSVPGEEKGELSNGGAQSSFQGTSPGLFAAAPVEKKAQPSGATSGWPVGYVPPPDDKYRELVVGNQVYLEGGTFYLSETGAYLLGLRG